MELSAEIQPGLSAEEVFPVKDEHAANHIGSGALRVLATPVLVGFMENVAHRMLAAHLPAGYSSVGAWVDIRHLAPTPVGDSVTVRAEITEVDGRRILFAIQAYDSIEKVGEARHQRAVIDVARFEQRLQDRQRLQNRQPARRK